MTASVVESWGRGGRDGGALHKVAREKVYIPGTYVGIYYCALLSGPVVNERTNGLLFLLVFQLLIVAE